MGQKGNKRDSKILDSKYMHNASLRKGKSVVDIWKCYESLCTLINRQNRTSRSYSQNREDRTGRTGQAELDRQNAKTEQDRQNNFQVTSAII